MMGGLRLLFPFLFLCLLVGVTRADRQAIDNSTVLVGVPTDTYLKWADPEVRGRQEHSQWGWAACLQQILNYHGVKVTQEGLVTRVLGEAKDEPVTMQAVEKAIPGVYAGVEGQVEVKLSTDITTQTLLSDLERNWPVLVGVKDPRTEHARALVLVAAYYQGDGPAAEITRVVLRDPDPQNPSRLEMSGRDFRTGLIGAHRISVIR